MPWGIQLSDAPKAFVAHLLSSESEDFPAHR